MKILKLIQLFIAILCLPVSLLAVERDVQMTNINFDTGVATLTNLGGGTEDLSGWRFCSHNTSLVRRYSGATGLNGISLAPGETLAIHYNNDAAAAGEINISTIGGAFAALERDAYGLQIYFAPVSFGNGNTIADHLQWSVGGIDNVTADERSDEAEAGGVWIDQSQWISVANDTDQVSLSDLTGGVLHSPANYVLGALPPPAPVFNVPFMPMPFVLILILVLGFTARAVAKIVAK